VREHPEISMQNNLFENGQMTPTNDPYRMIYVIDDDEIFHFIVKKMILMQGWNVRIKSFLCAEEGIRSLYESKIPALIILDMNMQRMNGWDFLAEFRKFKEQTGITIPIIMCSSSNSLTDMERVKETPELQGYITKPLDKLKMKVIETFLN
jgi:CheY-like chemotaxis protein